MIIKFTREQFKAGYDAALCDLLAAGRGHLGTAESYDLRVDEIERWAASAVTDKVTILDIVAFGLAADFDRKILAYEFAYRQTNDLQHLVWTSAKLDASRLLDELFLAFDASDFGESEHEREAIAIANVSKLLRETWLPRW